MEEKKIDWAAAAADYITGNMSYKTLADKWCVSMKSVERHSKAEGWREKRRKHAEKMTMRMTHSEERKQVKRRARYRAIEDKLLDKLEQAVDELDQVIKTKVTKTKTIKYENEKRPDKPTEEVITEEQQIDTVKVIIDRGGLAAVTNALEKLKSAQGIRSALDEEEQRARIDALKAKVAEGERGHEDTTVSVDFVAMSELDYRG